MKAYIKIACRQIINANSTGSFEKNIIRASYNEFLLKSQAYNPEKKFRTFQEMVQNDGRANSLHYKSGFAVSQFIKALNNKIPGLFDNLGKAVAFSSHKFEVIASDITDPSRHHIAITYMTDTLSLYGNMGDYLLLAPGEQHHKGNSADTFILKMREGLSIFSYQELTNGQWAIDNEQLAISKKIF